MSLIAGDCNSRNLFKSNMSLFLPCRHVAAVRIIRVSSISKVSAKRDLTVFRLSGNTCIFAEVIPNVMWQEVHGSILVVNG